MHVDVKIDALTATNEFKAARKDLNRRTKDGFRAAGEKVALPSAKRNAAGLKVAGRSVAGSLIVRPTARTAYLTSNLRGILGRAVGLQEFGGTVRTIIRPKKAKALRINGGFAASVTTPRHYKGKHFLSDSVTHNRPRIAEAVKREILKAYEGLEVSG